MVLFGTMLSFMVVKSSLAKMLANMVICILERKNIAVPIKVSFYTQWYAQT